MLLHQHLRKAYGGAAGLCKKFGSPKQALGTAHEMLAAQGFLSNVMALGVGAVIAQLLGVAGMALTARLFSPEDFGLLALFSAISLFFLPLVTGKYEFAVMIPKSDTEAANLVGLSSAIALSVSIFICAGALVFSRILLAFVGSNNLTSLLWTVGAPLNLFVYALNQVLGFWCTRIKEFRHMAAARIISSVIMTISPLLLYVVGLHTGEALIVGGIVGQAIGAGYLAFVGIRDRKLATFWPRDWRIGLTMLMGYRKFPLYGAPYSFVGGIGRQLLTVIIKSYAGLYVLGLFSVAMRTVFLPVSLISGSIRPVFYQRVCTDLNDAKSSIFVNNIIRMLMTISAPLLIFFCFNASYLFRIFLGVRWEAAGNYGALLALVSYLVLCISWMDRVFDAHGKQHVSLIWEILHTGTTLGGLIYGLVYLGSPVLAVGLYVAIEICYEMIWLKLVFSCGGFDLSELRSTLFSVCRLAMLISVLMSVCRLVAQPLDSIISIVVALSAVLLIGLRYLNARASESMSMMPRCSNLPLPD